MKTSKLSNLFRKLADQEGAKVVPPPSQADMHTYKSALLKNKDWFEFQTDNALGNLIFNTLDKLEDAGKTTSKVNAKLNLGPNFGMKVEVESADPTTKAVVEKALATQVVPKLQAFLKSVKVPNPTSVFEIPWFENVGY